MSQPRVVCTGPLDDYAVSTLARYGEVVYSDGTENGLEALLDGTIAIAVRGAAKVTVGIIDAATDLRVIGRTGVGYDNIDVPAATRRGIPVVYTPGAGARAVFLDSETCGCQSSSISA